MIKYLYILSVFSVLSFASIEHNHHQCLDEHLTIEKEEVTTLQNVSYRTVTTAQATTQVSPILEISPNNLAVSLVTNADYEADKQLSGTEIKVFNEIIYEKFKDDFDIIFYVENSDDDVAGNWNYYGRASLLQNNVKGIGKSLYNYSNSYHSAGKLLTTLHLVKRNYLTHGPSLHEIAHIWANGILDTSKRGHWGITGFESGGGQLGGFKNTTLVHNNDNNYSAAKDDGSTYFSEIANGGNGLAYNDFELYLMGLIPASEVGDIKVAINGVQTTYSDFTADGFDTKSIENIVNEFGGRVPDSSSSKKQFRALVVVLTQEPLLPSEWDTVENSITTFEHNGADNSSLFNFYEATGGRATMSIGNVFSSLKSYSPPSLVPILMLELF